MVAGSVPGKLHQRGCFHGSLRVGAKIDELGEHLQAALGLEIATRGAANDHGLPIFGSQVAVEGVHGPFCPGAISLGCPGVKRKPRPGAVVEHNAGALGDVPGAKGMREDCGSMRRYLPMPSATQK